MVESLDTRVIRFLCIYDIWIDKRVMFFLSKFLWKGIYKIFIEDFSCDDNNTPIFKRYASTSFWLLHECLSQCLVQSYLSKEFMMTKVLVCGVISLVPCVLYFLLWLLDRLGDDYVYLTHVWVDFSFSVFGRSTPKFYDDYYKNVLKNDFQLK